MGVLFALLHAFNPSASVPGIVNTAGFGILFGYAFLRSHDSLSKRPVSYPAS